MQIALLGEENVPYARGPAASGGLSVPEMLLQLRAANAVLMAVLQVADRAARPFIAGSRTDIEGATAIACDELLVHTWDIGRGLGRPFVGPGDLVQCVVARLFPWAPDDDEPWRIFLWCNGRIPLGARRRLGPDWPRWLAPREEWQGTDPTESRKSATR